MFVHWDFWNRTHISKHGVSQEEAEYIILHAAPPYPQDIGEGKIAVWGQTAAGRFLQVIFVYRSVEEIRLDDVPLHRRQALSEIDEVAYIIHARDLKPIEKRRFRRRRSL